MGSGQRQVRADSSIVTLKRHFPQGFKLTTSDGLQMETDVMSDHKVRSL
jgi:hypothetical protein